MANRWNAEFNSTSTQIQFLAAVMLVLISHLCCWTVPDAVCYCCSLCVCCKKMYLSSYNLALLIDFHENEYWGTARSDSHWGVGNPCPPETKQTYWKCNNFKIKVGLCTYAHLHSSINHAQERRQWAGCTQGLLYHVSPTLWSGHVGS